MSYRFFANEQCEYYPCHDLEEINCLFCFCPLYLLEECGGNYEILDNGIKDCSGCLVPHTPGGYDHIIEKLGDVKSCSQ